MQFSGLRSSERVPAWIPFSNSLQWLFSASVTLYVLDYSFCCNWWDFILCNGWVINLLKMYKPAFLLIKYLCFTNNFFALNLIMLDNKIKISDFSHFRFSLYICPASPGMAEPGGLPSIGSHRVGHDWSDLAAAAAYLNFKFNAF